MDEALAAGRWRVAALLGVYPAVLAANAVLSKETGRHFTEHGQPVAPSLVEALSVPSAQRNARLLAKILAAKEADAHYAGASSQREATVVAERARRFVEWVEERIVA
jgi:hypothetical protein